MSARHRLSVRTAPAGAMLARAAVALAFAALAFAVTAPAVADTVYVPSGQPTIQAGIDAAGQNGTVIVAAGTYSGPGNVDIDMRGLSVTVTGAGSSSTIIDCGLAGRAFSLTSPNDTTAVIENLTVRNAVGLLGGGVYVSAASPTIRNCAFEDCTADNGGAIYATGSASPTISDCSFEGNTAEDGGALYIASYGGGITGCTFDGNIATNGGALSLSFPTELPLVSGCRFERNMANAGGAVYYDQAETSFEGCAFFDNTAALGGGIYLHDSYNLPSVTNCSFVANDGGGAVSFMAELAFSRCIFAFDRSGPGFSCLFAGFEPTITQSYVFGNAGGDSLCGGYADNRFEDPLLCGLATGDLTLCSNSPCISTQNPWGLDIGAHGEDCGDCDSPVRNVSWGVLKGLYR